MKWLFIFVVALVSFNSIAQSITNTTVYSTKDSYTVSSNTSNFGSAASILAGISIRTLTASYNRSFVYFSLSGIDSRAIITSATLKVYQSAGATSTPSTALVTERITSSWAEGTIASNNEPTVATADPVSSSTYASNWRSFDVKAHVQKMVNGTFSNEGWRIRYYNEAQTTADLYTFDSREGTNDPKLEISYYIPFNVSSATINHCTTTGASDGSISVSVANGPSSPTYQWYNSSGILSGQTSSSITSRPYGWYGLKISGSTGDPVYMAFIIGVNCQQVAITFDPGKDYIDDAILSEFKPSEINTTITQFTTGSFQSISWWKRKSTLRFRMWMDNDLTIDSANLYLKGNNHIYANRSNESVLKRVTSYWHEDYVCWSNGPTSTTTNQVSIAQTTSSTQSRVLDIRNFWNTWKSDNTANNGMIMELSTYGSPAAEMNFYSSDATTSDDPYINFRVFRSGAVAGTASTSDYQVCVGESTTVSLTGYSVGATFQWQESTDNVNFSNISGATSSTYATPTNLSGIKYFRCRVTVGTCSPVNSNSVLIQGTVKPTLSLNQPDFCSGASVTVTATPSAGGGTYLWNTSATTQSIIVAPLTNTTYTVVYTLNGCSSNQGSSTVDVCQMHAKLERTLSGNNYKSFAGKLVFYYQEEYSVGNSNLTYSVYPMNNRITPVLSGSGLSQSLEYGDNRYMLDLSSISSGTYILEVENAKKEKFYLRFTK